MLTDGTVVSGAGAAGFTVQENDCVWVNRPSDTKAITLKVPAVVPDPEMNPVLAINENPGGSPVAL